MSEANEQDNEVLDGLMREAELRARTLLERRGGCAPFVQMSGVDGSVTFYDGDEAVLSKQGMEYFKKAARLACISEGADAAVFVAEAWLTRENSHLAATDQASAETADREEAVVLLGETRAKGRERILPILRDPNGNFRGFGRPHCKESLWTWRQGPGFLPAWVPTEREREAAENGLIKMADERDREEDKKERRSKGIEREM